MCIQTACEYTIQTAFCKITDKNTKDHILNQQQCGDSFVNRFTVTFRHEQLIHTGGVLSCDVFTAWRWIMYFPAGICAVVLWHVKVKD